MAEDKTTVGREDVDLDADLVTQGGYVENPDHKPNPFYQYGNLDTTDLGANASEQMGTISPVFEVARANNLATAARALDPEDPTPAELVVLPEAAVTVQGSAKSPEDARSEVYGAVKRLQENPVVLGSSPAAAQAALGTTPEDADDEVSEDERRRAEFKEEAAATHEERIAAQREKATVTGSPVSGPDVPVAGTSSTPSATPPKEDTTSGKDEGGSTSSTAKDSGSTSSTARKSTTTAKSTNSK